MTDDLKPVAVPGQPEYRQFLDEIKSRVRQSRLKAARAVNRELIQLYWWLGKAITDKQEQLGWGKSVVEQLAADLQRTFEGRSGFSAQNMWYMRQFYLTYRDDADLQQLVGEIPWGQNLAIMAKVKDPAARRYYLKATIEMGWSRMKTPPLASSCARSATTLKWNMPCVASTQTTQCEGTGSRNPQGNGRHRQSDTGITAP